MAKNLVIVNETILINGDEVYDKLPELEKEKFYNFEINKRMYKREHMDCNS